ncbi:MAG: RIP metalloprotease RseP [Bdellovibrionales bacterium RIFCSPHIGHO2_01_FULL_40_29]|nr:MAG: RIP metalloprotease RseP [Bdellovibrionales bacterium RIFCSPHIGHO2_01_FULL_40_29]OFZ33126.1 MAG: RIP metalloprotease RseP [Bdellovibrionales bacterium RIFCSPHIGHO2_02_FULL_40_15]
MNILEFFQSVSSGFLSGIIPFTILLGILIFVHELGHFAVARMCGVRVEVFSLGFGKKILSYKKGDTTYCLSLIPLGGYVKMFGEQNGDTVSEADRVHSFTHKTVWQRIAIVLAGPLMNFFFAIAVFTFISVIGEETRAPVIAEVESNSPAATMGLSAGDRILSINATELKSYEDLQKFLNANQNSTVTAKVKTISGEVKDLSLTVASIKNPNIFSTEKMIGDLTGVLPLARGTTVGVIAGSIAEKTGLKPGDEIIEINKSKVSKWTELEHMIRSGATLEIIIEREVNGKREKIPHTISQQDYSPNMTMLAFGLEQPDLYLDQVVKDSPAEQAELKRYDKIVQINSVVVTKWEQILATIKSFDGKDGLMITVIRDGAELTKKITPQVTSQMTAQGKEDRRYTIGILPFINYSQPEMVKVKADGVFSALTKGTERTWDITSMTVISFVRLFQGEISHKNVGGMISIGKAAKDSYESGLQSFLMVMGILSVSLFILNLLPIPVLDGGHLVFYFIEAIKGSPLSIKKMEIAQQVGFILLMGLMVLAIFNDVNKFFFKS